MVNVGKYGSIFFYQSPLIYSGLSPPATMANEGLVWDPLSKKFNNPGGYCCRAGGQPKIYYFLSGFPKSDFFVSQVYAGNTKKHTRHSTMTGSIC